MFQSVSNLDVSQMIQEAVQAAAGREPEVKRSATPSHKIKDHLDFMQPHLGAFEVKQSKIFAIRAQQIQVESSKHTIMMIMN